MLMRAGVILLFVVPARGVEPRLPQSKCGVLPLDEAGMAKVAGFEPAITVLETVALGQTKLHRHGGQRDEELGDTFISAM